MGKCRICSREGKLSFEHVPPQKAYNQETVIEYTLETRVRNQKVKGKQRQGGIGEYTLCEKCNPDTGSWYGTEYGRWATMAFDALNILSNNPDILSSKNAIAITLKDVYPLRFLKQVITCLFSVISISPSSDFADNNPELVKFILDKNQTNLPETYNFYLSLYRKPSILRRFPLAGKLTLSYNKDMSGNIIPGTTKTKSESVFSEMAHPPFALVMTHGTPFPDATNISYFKNFRYDEYVDLVLPLKIRTGLTPYPGSYQ
jgi:hypothetical protein